MKILYVPGPLNAVRTYNIWLEGDDDSSSVAIPYLRQFFERCKQESHEAIICSSVVLDDSELDASNIIDNAVSFEYVPAPFQTSSGLLFHLGQILYLLRIGWIALTQGANVILMTAARQHLFALLPVTWFGISVIPTLHCTFWPRFEPPNSLIKRIILRLTGGFLRSRRSPILAFPGEVSRQVFELAEPLPEKRVFNFLPTYKPELFEELSPPNQAAPTFHILYLGRVTRDKGVFTIVDIAKGLVAKGLGSEFVFDICGEGPALEALRAEIAQNNLGDMVFCHGFCDRTQVVEMLNQSHIIIVPTTTSFIEGFNKVVVEGVLASRPVVTSAVCPSLVTVQDAVVEVDPEGGAESYLDAILALQSNKELYLEKHQFCLKLQSQFYSQETSWGMQLSKALSYL